MKSWNPQEKHTRVRPSKEFHIIPLSLNTGIEITKHSSGSTLSSFVLSLPRCSCSPNSPSFPSAKIGPRLKGSCRVCVGDHCVWDGAANLRQSLLETVDLHTFYSWQTQTVHAAAAPTIRSLRNITSVSIIVIHSPEHFVARQAVRFWKTISENSQKDLAADIHVQRSSTATRSPSTISSSVMSCLHPGPSQNCRNQPTAVKICSLPKIVLKCMYIYSICKRFKLES